MSQGLVFQHKAWKAEVAFNLSVWMMLSTVRHLAHDVPNARSLILQALKIHFPYAISCSVGPEKIKKKNS